MVQECEIRYIGTLGTRGQPEAGDWYARNMYVEGNWQYGYHIKKYGHPWFFGFKDVINECKARTGILMNWYHYTKVRVHNILVLANHHVNLYLYDSKPGKLEFNQGRS